MEEFSGAKHSGKVLIIIILFLIIIVSKKSIENFNFDFLFCLMYTITPHCADPENIHAHPKEGQWQFRGVGRGGVGGGGRKSQNV